MKAYTFPLPEKRNPFHRGELDAAYTLDDVDRACAAILDRIAATAEARPLAPEKGPRGIISNRWECVLTGPHGSVRFEYGKGDGHRHYTAGPRRGTLYHGPTPPWRAGLTVRDVERYENETAPTPPAPFEMLRTLADEYRTASAYDGDARAFAEDMSDGTAASVLDALDAFAAIQRHAAEARAALGAAFAEAVDALDGDDGEADGRNIGHGGPDAK